MHGALSDLVGNNAWGPLRFDLFSTDKYTNVTPNAMQELGELSKNAAAAGGASSSRWCQP